MADVSYFNLSEQQLDEQFDNQHHTLDLVDSLPYWSHDFDIYTSDTDPPPPPPPSDQPQFPFDIDELYHHDETIRGLYNDVSNPDSVTTVDFFDRGNQVNFVMDLFQERVEQSHVMGESDLVQEAINGSDLGIVGGNGDMGSNYLELDLGLGLGSGVNRDDNFGFMDESDDDFFVGGGRRMTCLPGVGFESDSNVKDLLGRVGLGREADFGVDHDDDDHDMGVNILWGSLQLEEDHREANEDFEWEEVDGRIDERDLFSMALDANEGEPVSVSVSPANQSEEELDVERVGALVNFEWGVLFNVDSLVTNREILHDSDLYLSEADDYIPTAEYEMLFSQFAENENALIGRSPTLKSVVENLPVVVMTQEDVANNNAVCAVCKDEMNVGENAKQLPCLHRYHGDCILPWLCIRNTCPVCRYELPS